MTVRTILVPVRGDGKGEGVLDHALGFARRSAAHLDVVHCRPRPEDFFSYGVSVPAIVKKDILSSAKSMADEEERKVKELFEDYCRRHDLTFVEEPPWPTDRISVSWREKTGKQAAIVGLYGRLADVVAIAKPDPERNLGMNTLEAALLETGRLILLCPPKPAGDIGVHITVAWNGSNESARAIALGLPSLQAAEKVTILTASDGATVELGADELAVYLGSHHIPTEIQSIKSRATEVGQALLRTCADIGADVLLMGAYGQSRRRELMLGGVTQHVIEHTEMPILLTH